MEVRARKILAWSRRWWHGASLIARVAVLAAAALIACGAAVWQLPEKMIRKEFKFTNFKRSFSLPKTVAVDKIEAHFNAGILTLILPKMEEAKSKEKVAILVN